MSRFECHYPLKPSTLRQGFGKNDVNYQVLLGLKGHPGEDWANVVNGQNLSYGQPIYATCDGTVIEWLQDSRGGWNFETVTNQQFDLDPDPISGYGGETTYVKVGYDHCIEGSAKFKVGDQVKMGDVIALCGSSGVVAGQPVNIPVSHVHYSVKPAIKMPMSGDEPAWYRNTVQDNGYGGAINNAPYWSGQYAVDVRAEEDTVAAATSVVSAIADDTVNTPQQKLSWLDQIKAALIALFKLLKK